PVLCVLCRVCPDLPSAAAHPRARRGTTSFAIAAQSNDSQPPDWRHPFVGSSPLMKQRRRERERMTRVRATGSTREFWFQSLRGFAVAEALADLSGRVLLVGSSGGHLAQLLALAQLWPRENRHWVTFDTADAISQLVAD